MTIDELRSLVERAERDLAHKKGQRDRVVMALSQSEVALTAAGQGIAIEEQIQDVLNKVAALSWGRTKGSIETLVTRALKAVYPGRDFAFVIEHETKRGTSSVKFILREGDIEVDPWEDAGLGPADIIGFTLRMLYVTLRKPAVRPILFMDEPFKNVRIEDGTLERAVRFMKQLSRELGVEMVVVSHNSQVMDAADRLLLFEKVGDTCTVTEQTVRA